MFLILSAVLSAFLDALTVIAVIISVGIGFYSVYHKVSSGKQHHHLDPGAAPLALACRRRGRDPRCAPRLLPDPHRRSAPRPGHGRDLAREAVDRSRGSEVTPATWDRSGGLRARCVRDPEPRSRQRGLSELRPIAGALKATASLSRTGTKAQFSDLRL